MPETKKSSDRISPKKLSDLKVVVLCIAAATTFWILNALNKDDYNTIVDFPISFVYDKEAYVPVSEVPQSIQVEISGNGWDLLRKYFNFNNEPYPITLDNPAKTSHILTADLKRSLGEFLNPTQLISVLDDTLKVNIDKIESIKIKPVLDSGSFTLAKNFRIIDEVIFEPKEVTVKGPTSMLEKINGTLPVELDESKIDHNIQKKLTLSVPKEYRDLVTIENPEVIVKFEVVQFFEGNKRLKVKKINFPRTVTMENEDAIIMMSYLLDERKVNELKDLEFEAILDYAKRNKFDSTVSVQVKPMPAYLEQVVVEPPVINLKYE